jgi:hypothetical protein
MRGEEEWRGHADRWLVPSGDEEWTIFCKGKSAKVLRKGGNY